MRPVLVFVLLAAGICLAGTTVDPSGKEAYSPNTGWVNAAADGVNGAVVGQSFCSGFMYGANTGWVSLGNGAPVNGMKYGNDTNADCGVNHDGQGNLTGYAYGANIGWINFEHQYGKPRIDLATGELSGSIWSANAGWIQLATLHSTVSSRLALGPDSDRDGLPDAWELGHTNQLAVLGGTDSDGDGISDDDEYLADTDPLNPDDKFCLSYSVHNGTNEVSWMSRPTRQYSVEFSDDLTKTSWTAMGEGMMSGNPEMQGLDFPITSSNGFIRVRANPPLTR